MQRGATAKMMTSVVMRWSNYVLLLAYLLLMMWYVLLGRGVVNTTFHIAFFRSYVALLSGNWLMGRQIVLNILLYVPVGFGLAACSKKRGVLVAALLLSVAIEVLQLVMMRGVFDFDDVLNNTAGAVVGWLVYGKIGPRIGLGLFAVLTFALAFVCVCSTGTQGNAPSVLCFQVGADGEGFAFLYGENTPQHYSLSLRSTTTGELKPLETELGLARSDADAYFDCGWDYTWSGFRTDVDVEGEWEYYVIVSPLILIPTGTYISEDGIHRVREESFESPTLAEDFVRFGTPLVWRPDEWCWVYQYQGCLYWIVDEGFRFEEDGSTYIHYQMWTTRPDKLPYARVENGWDWDNIGGNFEDYELEGDFGRYRVMRRHLPTAYPITSIMTGYRMDGRWVWRECFRPVYDLG